MKRFTLRDKLWPAVLWLLAWQGLSMALNQRLLLASPLDTVRCGLSLAGTAAFWRSILFSMARILTGFALALALGVPLGILSAKMGWMESLLAPPLAVIRAVPVASFVILALIWIPSRNLSILIAFLIALPILYAAGLDGARAVDPGLSQMARAFCMTRSRRLRALLLPALLPRLTSAARVAMGLAWKSGVAAEVIGIPTGSIGEKLYKAKVYLATPELFAWTLVIVLLSLLCERTLAWGLERVQRWAEGA